jgi:hypothetical protein
MSWFLKYFRQKNRLKNLVFLAQNKAKLSENFIIALVFEKNTDFFTENWRKSQKIVIITSTPGRNGEQFYWIEPTPADLRAAFGRRSGSRRLQRFRGQVRVAGCRRTSSDERAPTTSRSGVVKLWDILLFYFTHFSQEISLKYLKHLLLQRLFCTDWPSWASLCMGFPIRPFVQLVLSSASYPL